LLYSVNIFDYVINASYMIPNKMVPNLNVLNFRMRE